MQRIVLLVLAGGILGCEPSPPAASSESQGVANEAVAPEVRLLEFAALSPPPGKGPLDAALLKEQAAAKANPLRADLWIVIAQSWVRLARNASDKSLYANAEAAARRALAIEPANAAAHNVRGLVMLDQHRFKEAIEAANAVLAADPTNSMALGTLSDANLELGQIEAATDAAQKMLDQKPNLPSYARAAHLKYVTGDPDAAKVLYRLAFDAGRGQQDREPAAWVLVEAAELFRLEADYEGAIAGFDVALERLSNFPPALAGKARALLALGRADDARPLAEQAGKARPDLRTAWLLEDVCLALRDDPCVAQARSDVTTLGEKDTLAYADYLSIRNEQPDRAVELATDELAQRANSEVQRVLAFAQYRAGNLGEAQKASALANRHGTTNPVLRYQTLAIRLANADEGARSEIATLVGERPAFEPTLVKEAAALTGQ